MKDTRPNIAICIPCQDEVKSEFAIALAAMTASAVRNFKLALLRGSSSIVANSRNLCIEQMMKLEELGHPRFDQIMFIDSDIVFPTDVIPRLIEHGKDVVGASYPRRRPPYDIMSCPLDPAKPNKEDSGVVEVAALPTGCMMIRRDVFDKLKRPYFRFGIDEAEGCIIGEDKLFCEMVRGHGYGCWIDLDLTLEIGHIGVHTFMAQVHEEPVNIVAPMPEEQRMALNGGNRH